MGERAGEAGIRAIRKEDFTGEVNPSYMVLMGNITIMAMAEQSPERRRKGRKVSLPHGEIHHPNGSKRRGEIAEAMFLTKAVTMGFSVGVLWGDSDKYDLIVDAGGRLLKVQVKSAHHPSKGGREHTLEEIGGMLGVTRERIRQLRDRALKRLREGQVGKSLASFAA